MMKKWDRAQIRVCWLNAQNYTAERGWVQDAVKQSWEKFTSVRFTDWSECPHATEQLSQFDVKIALTMHDPNSHIGRSVRQFTPSTDLNFMFSGDWPAKPEMRVKCLTNREACIRSIAIHEFGHIMGFVHEQLSPNAPQACRVAMQSDPSWESEFTSAVANPRSATALTPLIQIPL